MRLVVVLSLLAAPVLADEGGGTLNPEEMTINRILSDRAAAAGVPGARRLQAAGYDPDEITPDADDWKYDTRLYQGICPPPCPKVEQAVAGQGNSVIPG